MTDTAAPFTDDQLAYLERILSGAAAPRAAIPATGRIPDVADGEIIESAWGNAVRNRSVTPFANAADRDAATPAPPPGALCYLLDEQRLYAWNGTAWIYTSTPVAPGVLLTGALPNSTANVTIGTLVIPTAPYKRLIYAFTTVFVTSTSTVQYSIQTTESLSGASRIARGVPSNNFSPAVLIFGLNAGQTSTISVVINAVSTPGVTGSVASDSRYSRLDTLVVPN